MKTESAGIAPLRSNRHVKYLSGTSVTATPIFRADRADLRHHRHSRCSGVPTSAWWQQFSDAVRRLLFVKQFLLSVSWALAALAMLATDSHAQSVPEESPFLWIGKQYSDPNSGVKPHIRERYGNLPYEFPGAADCVVTSTVPEDLRNMPDLKWAELKSTEELDVCLFRVLTRLREEKLISDWLTQQGWVTGERSDSKSTARFYGAEGTLLQLGYYWLPKETGPLYGPCKTNPGDSCNYYSSKLTVYLDGVRGVLSVEVRHNHRWSK